MGRCGRQTETNVGWKPLRSHFACGLHCTANSEALTSHRKSKKMQAPSAFSSFFPLWAMPHTGHTSHLGLRPLQPQRPPSAHPQEFPPSPTIQLRNHFQLKMELGPRERQLLGPKYQHLIEKEFSHFIWCLKGHCLELCFPTRPTSPKLSPLLSSIPLLPSLLIFFHPLLRTQL